MTPLRTPRSAANWLGVSVKTLRGLVQDGELRYVNVGRGKKNIRRMFADEDLQDFKKRRTTMDAPCQSIGTKTRHSTITTSSSAAIGFTARRALKTSEKRKA